MSGGGRGSYDALTGWWVSGDGGAKEPYVVYRCLIHADSSEGSQPR